MTSREDVQHRVPACNGRIRALTRRWTHDVPMTAGEIGELFGYSRNTVHGFVRELRTYYRFGSSTRRFLPTDVAAVLRGEVVRVEEAA